MLKIISGDEPYLISEQIKTLCVGREVFSFNASDGFPTEALNTPSFLGESIVVLHVNGAEINMLPDFLDQNYENDLIVVLEDPDKRTKGYKALSKKIEAFNKSEDVAISRLVEWGKGLIDIEIARELLRRSQYLEEKDVSLFTLKLLCEKASLLYSEVGLKELDTLLQEPTESVYKIVKYLMAHDRANVVDLAQSLLSEGESELALLGLIQRPFRLYYLSQMADPGPSVKPYMFSDVASVGIEKTCKILDLIQEASDLLKSGVRQAFILCLLEIIETL